MKIPLASKEVSSVHAAALILGGAAFLSRLLGLFRDRLLASRFGPGDILDAYYAAFQIPDILLTLFLVGAASAAVMPIFMEYEARGRDETDKFVSNLLTVFSSLSLAVALAGVALAPWLVALAAPGFSGAKLATAVDFSRLIMLNAVLFGIGGIISSVLQARRRFFIFALPPIFYNLSIIAGILFLVPFFGPAGLAWGVLAGGVMQVLVQLPAFRNLGLQLRPRFNLGHPGLLRVMTISLPRVLALSMSQMTVAVLAAIASFFAAGSLSAFKLASNLMYVPVGLFGVSYALAVFPRLSGASLNGFGASFSEYFSSGVRNVLFWALPSATLLIVLRAHVVRVVLGGGVFSWEDTRLVAAILAVLSLAVVSESLLPLVMRAFYALGRTREPLVWDIVGSLAVVIFAVGFAALFSARPGALSWAANVLRVGDIAPPKILAVAFGFSLGSFLNVVLLLRALGRVAKKSLGVEVGVGCRSFFIFLGAAVLSGFAAYLALLPFPAIVATNTFLGIFVQGLAAGAVGFTVYGAILAWQGNAEILGLFGSLRRRLLSLRKTPQVYATEKLDGEGTK